MPAPRSKLAQQSGVALFMVLMVTLIIVALSVSLAVGVFSEHKISRSTADQAIARQAAEAALRDAEMDVMCQQWNATTNRFEFHSSIKNDDSNPTPNPRSYCTQMPKTCTQIGDAGADPIKCNKGMIAAPLATGSTSPTATNYKDCKADIGEVTGQPKFEISNSTASLQPYYTIEVYPDNTGAKGIKPVFRMRARGFGRSDSTIVDLESTYRPCDQ